MTETVLRTVAMLALVRFIYSAFIGAPDVNTLVLAAILAAWTDVLKILKGQRK